MLSFFDLGGWAQLKIYLDRYRTSQNDRRLDLHHFKLAAVHV
jgi:hypothetical protein